MKPNLDLLDRLQRVSPDPALLGRIQARVAANRRAARRWWMSAAAAACLLVGGEAYLLRDYLAPGALASAQPSSEALAALVPQLDNQLYGE